LKLTCLSAARALIFLEKKDIVLYNEIQKSIAFQQAPVFFATQSVYQEGFRRIYGTLGQAPLRAKGKNINAKVV